MTLLYKQYTDAYQAGTLNLNDVVFVVNLVREEYIPNENHTKADLKNFIICSTIALNGDIINKKSMSEIVDKIKEKLMIYIANNLDKITFDVNKILALKPDKAEKVVELIRQASLDNGRDFWEALVKRGVKYFVLEDRRVGSSMLCFCEEIN